MTRVHLRRRIVTYAERFLQAEIEGKIKKWHYSYSPTDTPNDTRYVFVDSQGNVVRLRQNEVQGYLDGLYQ